MKRIIVIDSEDPARKEMAAFLRGEGFDADEAADEIEAMKLLEANSYDLAILDLCVPDCFCTGLLHWIKEHFSSLDVIIVSSCDSIDCIVKTIRMGALNYVRKPVAFSSFLDIVREAIHNNDLRPKSLRRVNDSHCYRVDEGWECPGAWSRYSGRP